MKGWPALLPHLQTGERVRSLAVRCLPAALIALTLTWPLYRQIRLWQLEPTVAASTAGQAVFIYFSDIPALVAFLLWLGTLYPRRARNLPVWLSGTLFGLAALITLSALWAQVPLRTLYYAARFWMLLVLYAVIGTTPGISRALIWGIGVAGALQAVVGIAQFAEQGSLGLTALGEKTLDPTQSGVSVLTVEGTRILRAYGLTSHPNILGGILAIAAWLSVSLVLDSRGGSLIVALALTALSFTGMLFSFSRSAWIGFAVAALIGVVLLKCVAGHEPIPWKKLGLALAVLLICGLAFALTQWPLLRPRLGLTSEGVEIRSLEERAVLEVAAWALIREHPWLGVGYGNFTRAARALESTIEAAYPLGQPVHRVPLLVAAELGLPGALLWLLLTAGPWAAMWARRHIWCSPAVLPGVAIGLPGALAILTVIGWFDFYPWLSHQGRLAMWVLLGLWAGTLYIGQEERVERILR